MSHSGLQKSDSNVKRFATVHVYQWLVLEMFFNGFKVGKITSLACMQGGG